MSSPYAERNRTLRRMGFRSYEQYLASDLWREVRGRVLAVSGRCAACGRRATQVHHLQYDEDTLAGRSPEHLIGLCWLHHEDIEFTSDGQKRHLTAANVVLRKLLKIGAAFEPEPVNRRRIAGLRGAADDLYYRAKIEAGLFVAAAKNAPIKIEPRARRSPRRGLRVNRTDSRKALERLRARRKERRRQYVEDA